MSWTRRKLRIVSAFCLAVLVYTAIPDFRADHPVQAGVLLDCGVAHSEPDHLASEQLLPDDAHESHSSGVLLDAHRCAICRDKFTGKLAVPGTEPFRLVACGTSTYGPFSSAQRADSVLGRRHPARAPPRA